MSKLLGKKFAKWVAAACMGVAIWLGTASPIVAHAIENYSGVWEQTSEGWKYKVADSRGQVYNLKNTFISYKGDSYFFGADGIMKTGWFTFNDFKYYADANGAIAKGWTDIDGKTYYFDDNGCLVQGGAISDKYKINADGEYVGPLGAWEQVGDKWMYKRYDGTYVKSSKKYIDGYTYQFDDNGYMLTGWIKVVDVWTEEIDGIEYTYQSGPQYTYADASGRLLSGWQQIDGNWYYFSTWNGIMYSNELVDNVYYMDKDGVYDGRKSQWIQEGNKWKYKFVEPQWQWDEVTEEGYQIEYAQGGEFFIDGKSYYFDDNGYMMTGWIDVSELVGYYDESLTWIYVNEDGSFPSQGWHVIDGTWYYFDLYGFLVTDRVVDGYYVDKDGMYHDIPETEKTQGQWVKDSTGWWYSYADGGYAVADTWIDGKQYYFDKNGYMVTGWVDISTHYRGNNKEWHYFGEDGAGVTGWRYIDGNWYLFSYGRMHMDEYTDGGYIGMDGIWREDDGAKYLTDYGYIDEDYYN